MILRTLVRRNYSVYHVPNVQRSGKKSGARSSSGSRAKEMDQLGAWNTRINFPLSEEQSIKRGTVIPILEKSQVGFCSEVGRRTYQEDRFIICEPLPDLLALGVFDGHGGSECAHFCSEQFERFLMHRLNRVKVEVENEKKDLEELLHQTLMDLDTAFCRHWKGKHCPGSTATVALIRGGYELVTGQIGKIFFLKKLNDF